MDAEPRRPEETLAPLLSLLDTTFLVMGGIIGAGIFFAPRSVAMEQPGWLGVLVTWGIGGVIALTGSFVFAELGGRLPETGGQYAYLREAFGSGLAFFYGWNLLALVASGSTAVVLAVALFNLELMVQPLLGGLSETSIVHAKAALGTLVLAAFAMVNTRGVKLGAWVHNGIMAIKVASLAAVIVLGVWSVARGNGADDWSAARGIDWSTLGVALLPALFSFGGWQNVAAVAGEVRDVQRTLPKAIVIGSLAVLGLYLGLNASLVAVLGVEGIRESDSPVAALAGRELGGAAQMVVAAMVLVSTLGITQALLIMPPRIYYAMARDGVFFGVCTRLHPRWRTPDVAIGLQAGFALAHFLGSTLLGERYDLGTMIQSLVFVDWIFFALAGVAYFVFRWRWGRPPTYRAPCFPWVPAVFTLASVAVVVETVRALRVEKLAVPAAVLGVGAMLLLSRLVARPRRAG